MELSRKISHFRNQIIRNVIADFGKNLIIHEYVKDKSGTYINGCINQAKAAGFDKVDDLIGSNDRELLKPDEAIKIALNDKQVIQERSPLVITECITRFDGKKIVVTSFKTALIKGKAKILGLMGFSIMHDLKPHNLAEEVNLTLAQLDCLFYLVKGCSIKEIARHLSLSPRTIEHTLESIKIKLNCTRKSDLVSKALEIPSIREKL
jgi:DNA-binding CsgD family transcriptional regulator